MVLGERVTSQSCLYEWMMDLYKEKKTCVGNNRVIGVSRQEKGEAMNESAGKGGGGNVRGRKGLARREEVEERKRREEGEEKVWRRRGWQGEGNRKEERKRRGREEVRRENRRGIKERMAREREWEERGEEGGREGEEMRRGIREGLMRKREARREEEK